MTRDQHHLASLDVVRGVSVAAMILVNNPGDWNSVFPALTHTDWNGWTFADIVFPCFVFIMGCAIPFTFARQAARHGSQWQAGTRVLRRSVMLVALGLVLNLAIAAPHFSAVRIPGVLQRLGVAYLGAAMIVRSCGPVAQAAVTAALLAGHWAVLTLVSIAGPYQVLTRSHNLAGVIDAQIFGSHTLMPGFDPEGLLGTAPTIATALLGALTGEWLRDHNEHRRQLAAPAIASIVAICAGLFWSIAWPINKPLWTGSYALLMSGLAGIMLVACVFVVDILGARGWARPFLALGVNPLAIYFGSEFVGHLLDRSGKSWIYWNLLAPLTGGGGEWTSLLFALAYVGCWLSVAIVLDRRHVRIRV